MGLGAGLFVLDATLKVKKHMRTLGVDDAAKQRFEQEQHNEHARVFGNVIITDSWASNKTITGLDLFPLSEIEFFKKDYSSGRYGTRFYVVLRFKDFKEYNLPCDFEEQHALMAVLKERCPQANQRPVKE